MPATSSVTLAWNPSPSTNVVSYKIYYGTASGQYGNSVSVTGSTNVVVTGLAQGSTYYFAATAVDVQGDQSPFSNESAYFVPISSDPLAATLASATPPARGQFALNINGVVGDKYVVQVSTNLVNWTSLQTNTTPFTFVDTNAIHFKQRFYRSYYYNP